MTASLQPITARDKAKAALTKCRKLPVRDYLIVDVVKWIVLNVLARQTGDGEFGPSPRFLSARPSHTGIQNGQESRTPILRRLERTAEFVTWSVQYLRVHTLGLRNM